MPFSCDTGTMNFATHLPEPSFFSSLHSILVWDLDSSFCMFVFLFLHVLAFLHGMLDCLDSRYTTKVEWYTSAWKFVGQFLHSLANFNMALKYSGESNPVFCIKNNHFFLFPHSSTWNCWFSNIKILQHIPWSKNYFMYL